MALITDNRVITWSDQRSRTIADAFEQFYAKLVAWQTDYAAQGIGALITAGGGTNLVNDSAVSAMDGREQVTGNAIGPNMLAAINQVVTAMGTTNVTGVGTTAKAVMDLVQVNGSAR